MPKSYEIYDNEKVQLATRRQAGHLAVFVILGACLTAVLLPVMMHYGVSLLVTIPLFGIAWAGMLWIVFRRRRLLRRIVWCVKISRDRILGYNYERRPTSLRWSEIDCLNVTSKGIFLCGDNLEQRLHVTDLFEEYADLGHVLLGRAEQHGVQILVDNQPLEDLDVYELCPFLMESTSHRAL